MNNRSRSRRHISRTNGSAKRMSIYLNRSYRRSRNRGRVGRGFLRQVISEVLLLARRMKRGRHHSVSYRADPNANGMAVSECRSGISNGRCHAASTQRMDSPSNLISRLMPRARIRVCSRRSFNDRCSERCLRAVPMITACSITRCVRVTCRRRRDRRNRSSRVLRHQDMDLSIILVLHLTRGRQLMDVTRDLNCRYRSRHGLTNYSMSSRLYVHVTLLVSMERRGLVNYLIRGANGAGRRSEPTMTGRFFSRRLNLDPENMEAEGAFLRFLVRRSDRNENTSSISMGDVFRVASARRTGMDSIRHRVTSSRRRLRNYGLR